MQLDPDMARRIGRLWDDVWEEMEKLKEHLAKGGCSDFEQYRHVVGRLDGLGRASDLIKVHLVDPLEIDD